MNCDSLPATQCAVEITAPGAVRLNTGKAVCRPGPRQLLCRVEAAGLCFSDLKLMDQFAAHPRKRPIVSGIAPTVLAETPSYVPGELPAVPGHEAVVRICAAGEEVRRHRVGERYLVQTDYRWLPTEGSNASFGYNFEGALQEYVLMDERVITSPEGESMLIAVSERLSASAVALVEPWACVEDAYAERQRRARRDGGRAIVVADDPSAAGSVPAAAVAGLSDGVFDDITYLGSSADVVERLFAKLAPGGLLNIALCGGRFPRKVACPVGRVHYGGMRIVGTTGSDPARSMQAIPTSAEVREGARVLVIGAGGPMGTMHVIRVLCAGVPRVRVVATDTDDARLARLARLARPLAERNGLSFEVFKLSGMLPTADYVVVTAPAPQLVTRAVDVAAPGGIVNIFAGIPADVAVSVDVNAYLEKQLYFVGTSGSVLEDMRSVLAKVEDGRLDTNLSVAAISGLEGAIDGLRAVERRQLAGKVIVYPWCHGLGLTRLEELTGSLPAVAQALDRGRWTAEAEARLAETFDYSLSHA